MTFTITYRSQSGALQKEVVEAANRAAALEQAKSRGIAPVSVKEGGTLAAVKTVARPAWIKGAVAGLVVVVVAVIAFFCLMPTEKPAAPKVEKPKKVKVEKPDRIAERKKVPQEMTDIANLHEDVNLLDRRCLNTSQKDDFSVVVSNVPGTTLAGRSDRNSTEQVLAWLFTCEVGELPPVLPTLPESELRNIKEILASQSIAESTDGEMVVEAKRVINLAKKSMQDYLAQGGLPENFLKFYHDQLVQAHQEKQMATMEVKRLIREDPELAREFLIKVNQVLGDKGIGPVKLTKVQKAKLGVE